jgi:hypothetical protein
MRDLGVGRSDGDAPHVRERTGRNPMKAEPTVRANLLQASTYMAEALRLIERRDPAEVAELEEVVLRLTCEELLTKIAGRHLGDLKASKDMLDQYARAQSGLAKAIESRDAIARMKRRA